MADDIVTHCLRTADEMEAEGDSFSVRPSSSFMREVAAEIERLRELGDAMAYWYENLGPSMTMRDAVYAWQEARRG